jgi:hypothetical protein
MSACDPACVKTRTSGEDAELFSPFASFVGERQCCCYPIQRNLDRISTRKSVAPESSQSLDPSRTFDQLDLPWKLVTFGMTLQEASSETT